MLTKTSERVLEIIKLHLVEQNEKGIVKYGKNIDEAIDGDYDWNTMVIEELVDGIQYVVKENQRLINTINKLQKKKNINIANEVVADFDELKTIEQVNDYRKTWVQFLNSVVDTRINEIEFDNLIMMIKDNSK